MNLLDVYVVVLFIIGFIYLIFFFYAMIARDNALAKLFALHSIFASVYIFGVILQMRAESLEQITLYQKVKYFGSPFIPLTLFLLSYRIYTREYPRPLIFICVLIAPILVFLLNMTNEYHHLYYKSVSSYSYQGYLITERKMGLLYPIGVIYNLVMVVYSLMVYYRLFFKGSKYFKNAYLTLTIGLICLTISSTLYFLDVTPHSIDTMPIGFLVLAIAYAIIIFKFNLFASQDIYHKVVFDNLYEGIMIIDEHGYLIDFNPAAKNFLPWLSKEHIGQNISDFEYGKFIFESENRSFSLSLNINNKTIYTDFNVTEIKRKNKVVGYVYLFVDNTERYLTMQKLRYYARHDTLTEVYNKSVIIEEATELLNKAKNNNSSAAVVFIDVDNFKKINDSYGHLAGDYILKEVAKEFLMILDYTGVYGRFGGDEFLIVLTELPLKKVLSIIRTLRENIINKEYSIDNNKINVTLSIGIAYVDYQIVKEDVSLSDLIRQADRALYRSKNTGKNAIKIYSQ